jgi:hypothetical protein
MSATDAVDKTLLIFSAKAAFELGPLSDSEALGRLSDSIPHLAHQRWFVELRSTGKPFALKSPRKTGVQVRVV